MSSPRSRIVFNSPSLRTRLFCKSAGTSFVIVSPVFWSLTTIIFFVAMFTFIWRVFLSIVYVSVSYTHLRAHETRHDLVCRLLLEKKKQTPAVAKTQQKAQLKAGPQQSATLTG